MTLARHDALSIWHAGVRAVRGDILTRNCIQINDETLRIQSWQAPLSRLKRILVVGGGKGAGSMVAGLEQALHPIIDRIQIEGWVHVPDDCLQPTQLIRLHAARPPGLNEPTARTVEGTREMLRLVARIPAADLLITLLTGGGSALLCAPVEGISLEDKCQLARQIGAHGGDIHDLNAIRRCLSGIKGGGLRRASRAQQHVTLILSDVLGDPIDVIASGPTVLSPRDPDRAIAVMDQLLPAQALPHIRTYLQSMSKAPTKNDATALESTLDHGQHFVIGNLERAMDAAEAEARRLGYQVERVPVDTREPHAEEVAVRCANQLNSIHPRSGKWCLLGGGEPTVRLVDESVRGRGGRNQQLVVAAISQLQSFEDFPHDDSFHSSWVLLSAATDGEDGPTDAAGGWVDSETLRNAAVQGLVPAGFTHINNSYEFLERTHSLLRTGPTQTNVCDLRVILSTRI